VERAVGADGDYLALVFPVGFDVPQEGVEQDGEARPVGGTVPQFAAQHERLLEEGKPRQGRQDAQTHNVRRGRGGRRLHEQQYHQHQQHQ
jgi:hypothetical protein